MIEQVRDLLHQQCGFQADIAEMLLDDWKLRDQLDHDHDQTDLDILVAVCLGKVGEPLPETEDERRKRVELATRRQFALVLDGLLVAERAAELEGRRFDRGAIKNLLWTTRELAGPSPYAADSANALLKEVISDWQRSADLRANNTDDLNSWMVARVDQLLSDDANRSGSA